MVDKGEKKNLILDAAIAVFTRKGAVGTKIDDIAREAGIAKGTIYLYFKSKEEIFKSILHLGTDSEYDIHTILSADVPVKTKLNMILKAAVKLIMNDRYPRELMPELWAALIRSKERETMKNNVLQLHELIVSLLNEATGGKKTEEDCRIYASGIIAMLHGVVFLQSVDANEFPAETIMRQTITALLES
jgi:AcrR family transcriptional regulator